MTTAHHQPLQDIASTPLVNGSRIISCKGGRSAKGDKYPPVPLCHRPQSSRRSSACVFWVPATWCSQLPPPPPYPAPSRSNQDIYAPAVNVKISNRLQATCVASTSASSASSNDDHVSQYVPQPGCIGAEHDMASTCMESGTQSGVATPQYSDYEDSDLIAKLSTVESREAALAAIAGQVQNLSFDSAGCRIVQLALEVANSKHAVMLASELRGHIYRAATSPHGNYVIQKVIEVLPVKSCGFVAQELLGKAREVARHRYACRIFCRLIEHHADGVNSDEGTEALINEIMDCMNELCRNNFGHHVVNSVIENGLPSQRSKIAAVIHDDIFKLAKNRNASYVIGRALLYCNAEEKHLLVNKLFESPEGLVELAWSQYGCCVVRAVLRLPEYSQVGLAQLESVASELRLFKYGKRLLEEFHILPRGEGMQGQRRNTRKGNLQG